MKRDKTYRVTFRNVASFHARITVRAIARTSWGAIRRARKSHLLGSRWEVIAVA